MNNQALFLASSKETMTSDGNIGNMPILQDVVLASKISLYP